MTDDPLVNIYTVDRRIQSLHQTLDEAAHDAARQRQAAEVIREEYHARLDRLGRMKAAHTANAKSIEAMDRLIAERRERGSVTESAEEYRAILLERQGLAERRSSLKSIVFDELVAIEQEEAAVAELANEVVRQAHCEQLAESLLTQIRETAKQDTDRWCAEQARIASTIQADELTMYDRLAEITDGEPLAELLEQNRATLDFTCGGCYMQIPPERVNQLLMGKRPVQCVTCSRILYLSVNLPNSSDSTAQNA